MNCAQTHVFVPVRSPSLSMIAVENENRVAHVRLDEKRGVVLVRLRQQRASVVR